MALEVFQSGRAALEAVRGTDLTPTRIIYFESATEDQDVQTIRPAEHRNSYNPVYSAAAGPERNVLNFQGRLTYEDAVWWANLFFKAVATGTGAGANKTWTFLPSATSDDVKSATLQLAYADTIGTAAGWKYNYAMGQTLNLHFEKNDDGAVTFNANLLAAKAATSLTAFTGALSDRTTTLMQATGTSVYIDPTTIGSTADTKVVSVDFNLDLGPVPFYTLDGTSGANGIYRPNFRTWTAEITRQYDAITQRSAFVAKTIRKVRVATVGAVLGSGTYAFTLDLYGVYTARKTASAGGIITEVLTLEPVYDVASTSDHNLTIVNADASIT